MILLLHTISRILSALPLSVALAVGRGIGRFMGSIIRYRKKDAKEALRRSLPDRTESERSRIQQNMYQNLGMTLVEQLRISILGFADFTDRIDVHGLEHFESALSKNTGAIAMMAHIGNWELCGFTTTFLDRPISVVVKPMRNPRLESYLTSTRQKMNLRILPVTTSYRQCIRTLRKGEILAMIMDQNTQRDKGVFVDFFGQPACTTLGLAILSAQTAAPVVPLFNIRRDDHRYDLIILPPIEPPPDRQKETLKQFTQQYTRIIEDMIRKYPDQWIWIHRRWRTKPLQEQAID